jgi:hypothetical protein
MIGLSLSLCIKEIVTGKVKEEDVERLITGTKCPDLETFKYVLDEYSKTYWKEHPEAVDIAMRFWLSGKIDQPRVRDEEPPEIWSGCWR